MQGGSIGEVEVMEGGGDGEVEAVSDHVPGIPGTGTGTGTGTGYAHAWSEVSSMSSLGDERG